MSELESGGNIKFLPGDPSHSWYKSCVELMMSRFSALEMQVHVGASRWVEFNVSAKIGLQACSEACLGACPEAVFRGCI